MKGKRGSEGDRYGVSGECAKIGSDLVSTTPHRGSTPGARHVLVISSGRISVDCLRSGFLD